MSAGRLRVQVPSGPPFLSECSSVFRAPGLGPGDRRCNSCHADQFCRAAVVEHIGIRLLIGTMQVGILPAAPIARWCQSSTPVCLTARCWCESNPGSQFWKAGRYKLAAPVSKTGSAHAEVGALPTPSANSNPSRSSKAERSLDKRKTVEHYHAGRPISPGS